MKKLAIEFKVGNEDWIEDAWGQTEGGENVPAEQVKRLLYRVATNAHTYTGTEHRTERHALVIDGRRFEIKFLEWTD